MGRLVFGNSIESGALLTSGAGVYQPFRPNKDIVLIGLRHWIIFYNNPVINNLKCSIYADDFSSGVHLPSTKIVESSKVWLKSEIITQDNGHFEIYYDFDSIPLQSGTFYHVVFNADTYAPTGSSHVAIMLGYPDWVYSEGITFAVTSLHKSPYALYFIGADF